MGDDLRFISREGRVISCAEKKVSPIIDYRKKRREHKYYDNFEPKRGNRNKHFPCWEHERMFTQNRTYLYVLYF